jgi:subtilisin family serine protease
MNRNFLVTFVFILVLGFLVIKGSNLNEEISLETNNEQTSIEYGIKSFTDMTGLSILSQNNSIEEPEKKKHKSSRSKKDSLKNLGLTSSELEKIDEVVKEELQENAEPNIKILVKKIVENNATEELPEYISVEVPIGNIGNLAKNNSVEMIYLNQEYNLLLEDSVPQIKAPVVWNLNYTGKGIKVAVLDTGIDYNNSAFQDRVILSKEFTGENHTKDNIGHGTHVAGIIASNGGYKGVAPNALLLNAKVLSDSGSGSTSTIIAGIYWAVENKADIISLSLGKNNDKTDIPLKEAIEYAINKGTIVIVASGNCGSCGTCNGFNGVTSPGNFEEVITVGAVNDYNEFACFSSGKNYSEYIKPDVVAPGVEIISTYLNNNYKSMSGTSMATPHISGVVALLLEKNPLLNHSEIKSLLEDKAVDLGDEGKDIFYGSGMVDVGVLINLSNEDNQTIPKINNSEDKMWKYYKTNFTCESNLVNITGYKEIQILNVSTSKMNYINLGNIIESCEIFYVKENLDESFIVNIISFDEVDNVINHFVDEYTTEYFNSMVEKVGNNYVLRDSNKIIWSSNSQVYSIMFNKNASFSDLLDDYINKFPSDLGANLSETIINLKDVQKKIEQQFVDIQVQETRNEEKRLAEKQGINFIDMNYNLQGSCSSCGDGYFNVCDANECLGLGDCYWNYCVTGVCCNFPPPNGDEDYCLYKKQNGDGCNKEEWHCDGNDECSGTLICQDGGYSNDGCCNYNEKWDGSSHKCNPTCSEGYTGVLQCGSGNVVQKQYKNSDCSLIWKDGEDCDDKDYYSSWSNSYCSSGDLKRERTYYNYYCNGGSCSYSTSKKYEVVESCVNGCSNGKCNECDSNSDCGTYERCASGSCQKKTCKELGYAGACSNPLYSDCLSDLTNDIYSCEDVKPEIYLVQLCYKLSKECQSNQYCDDSLLGKPECIDIPSSCELTSAYWDKTYATEGEQVILTVNSNGNCDSASFEIWEYDCGYDYSSQGCEDSPVNKNPSNVAFINGIATTTWIAEWQDDGLDIDKPEYYFIAKSGDKSIKSNTPDLEVEKNYNPQPNIYISPSSLIFNVGS